MNSENKTRFAKSIISDYIYLNGIIEDYLKDEKFYYPAIYSSSSLGLAMLYLGYELDDEIKDYLSHRGGIIQHYRNDNDKDKLFTLTVRDILEM